MVEDRETESGAGSGVDQEGVQEKETATVQFYEPDDEEAKADYVNIVRIRTIPLDQTIELTFGTVSKPVLEEDLWIWPEHRVIMTAKTFVDMYKVMTSVMQMNSDTQ